MACHSTKTPEKPVQADTEKWSKLDKMLLEASGQSELIFSEELTCSFRAGEVSDIVIRDLRVICTDSADQQISATLKSEAADKAGLPVKHIYTRICGSSNGTQHPENWKPLPGVLNTKQGKKTRSCLDQTQRREIHNRKERDRRRRISLCCDELNQLVPFCSSDTDKATTLQWTIAFLKYIREIHGDSLKDDFQNTFCDKSWSSAQTQLCSSGTAP